MKNKYLIAGLFLAFMVIILGCAQKEQKLTEKFIIPNAEKSQESSQNAKGNISTNENQQIFDEVSSTETLDSALKELDSAE